MARPSRFLRCALLVVWAAFISGDAGAYSLDVISRSVSANVLAQGGSDSETDEQSALRAATGIASGIQANRLGIVASSVAFGQSILTASGLRVITQAQTNVRSRAESPMTGSALADASGQITFSVKKAPTETLPLLLRLETKLIEIGSVIGEDGLEGEMFVFTLENLTTHKTLYDSRLEGYPDVVLLPGLVGDVYKSTFYGSLALPEAARPFAMGLEIQKTLLVITGAEIPEPGTALLAAFGLAALGRLGRRFSEAA